MSGIDVLAVMDDVAPKLGFADEWQVTQAREAVAELIDAARTTSGIVRISGLNCLRLDAALTRVQGGQP